MRHNIKFPCCWLYCLGFSLKFCSILAISSEVYWTVDKVGLESWTVGILGAPQPVRKPSPMIMAKKTVKFGFGKDLLELRVLALGNILIPSLSSQKVYSIGAWEFHELLLGPLRA
jgi:hypothetical protein